MTAEKAAAGQPFTQKQIAAEIRVRPTTISIWRRDERFRRAHAEHLRQLRPVEVELALVAICRKAVQGSPKHASMVMQMAGFDVYPEDRAPGGLQGPAAAAIAQVQFIGLPIPPTPAQRDALNPPPGSAVIVSSVAAPPRK